MAINIQKIIQLGGNSNISLEANYDADNKTLDLFASSKKLQANNYIIPNTPILISSITEPKNSFSLELDREVGVYSDSAIQYNAEYKIKDNQTNEYISANIGFYPEPRVKGKDKPKLGIGSEKAQDDPNKSAPIELNAEKDRAYYAAITSKPAIMSFDITARSEAFIFTQSESNPIITDFECSISQKINGEMTRLIPLEIKTNDDIINFNYNDLPIEPGIYEFLIKIGIKRTSGAQALFKVEIS